MIKTQVVHTTQLLTRTVHNELIYISIQHKTDFKYRHMQDLKLNPQYRHMQDSTLSPQDRHTQDYHSTFNTGT